MTDRPTSACPDELQLELHSAGELAGEELEALRRHVRHCPACRARAEESESTDALLGDLRRIAGRVSASPPRGLRELPRLDGYEITRMIGRGGMGIVYEAEQVHPRRRVAIKIVRPDVTSRVALDRFRIEAESLARLDHPSVATIYEASTFGDEGEERPFFAMELVDGRPLTDFLDETGADRRTRLEVFTRVCDAVHHAHVRGVVHRDLKPANVLVLPDGTPKVLDFGVARIADRAATLSSDLTAGGAFVGTLAWMSPEQLGGDPGAVDSRADVWSLGAILFRILAGRGPYDVEGASLPAAIKTMTEQEPPSLADLDRSLAGDLATIAGKALEPDRGRRYDSAAELAEEVRRHLSSRPVLARPAGPLYAAGRFVRRHAVLVAATLLVVASVTAGLVTTIDQSSRARRAEAAARSGEKRAREGERDARDALRLLRRLLAQGDPDALGDPDPSFRRVLERAERWLAEGRVGGPEIAVAFRHALGTAYAGLGEHRRAVGHLEEALRLYDADGSADPADVHDVVQALARTLTSLGRLDAAERMARRAFDDFAARRPGDPIGLAACRLGLAAVAVARGDFDRARGLAEAVLDAIAREGGAHAALEATALVRLANAARGEGDLASAEDHLIAALEIREEVHGSDDVAVALTLRELGSLQRERGRHHLALRSIQRGLEIATTHYGDGHPTTGDFLRQRGLIEIETGKLDAAAESLRNAIQCFRRGTVRSGVIAGTLSQLAIAEHRGGDPAAAEEHFREALRMGAATVGAKHPDTIATMRYLARFLLEEGRPEEALATVSRCVELTREVHVSETRRLERALILRGRCLLALERGADAAESFGEALRLAEDAGRDTTEARTRLARARASR